MYAAAYAIHGLVLIGTKRLCRPSWRLRRPRPIAKCVVHALLGVPRSSVAWIAARLRLWRRPASSMPQRDYREAMAGRLCPLNPENRKRQSLHLLSQAGRPSTRVIRAWNGRVSVARARDATMPPRREAMHSNGSDEFRRLGPGARADRLKLLSEQIDGSFLQSQFGVSVEARWSEFPYGCLIPRAFQEKVGDRLEGSRGLFISYSRFHCRGPCRRSPPSVRDNDGRRWTLPKRCRRQNFASTISSQRQFRIAVDERRPCRSRPRAIPMICYPGSAACALASRSPLICGARHSPAASAQESFVALVVLTEAYQTPTPARSWAGAAPL